MPTGDSAGRGDGWIGAEFYTARLNPLPPSRWADLPVQLDPGVQQGRSSAILVTETTMLTRKEVQDNFAEALRLMDEFEFGNAPAQKAARKVADKLRDLGIPYVVMGGLAVAAHGHKRVTVDVDLLLTREGLAKFKEHWLGLGWVERFKGSKGMQDAEHKVKIDVLTPDEKPGDGKSCPFNFPSPESLGMEMGGIWKGIRILPLRELIELKLASGLTSVTRLKDHVDVMELIKVNRLANDFGETLHLFVREKYRELWAASQVKDPYEE